MVWRSNTSTGFTEQRWDRNERQTNSTVIKKKDDIIDHLHFSYVFRTVVHYYALSALRGGPRVELDVGPILADCADVCTYIDLVQYKHILRLYTLRTKASSLRQTRELFRVE